MKKAPKKIVFYDGDCGFCNKSVQFILRYEKDKSIYFTALQSNFALCFFQENHLPKPDLSTFYFSDGEMFLEKSDAALRVAKYLRFPFSLLRFFWIVPQFLRDKVYEFIAKRRQRLSKEFCVVPEIEDRKRFLS